MLISKARARIVVGTDMYTYEELPGARQFACLLFNQAPGNKYVNDIKLNYSSTRINRWDKNKIIINAIRLIFLKIWMKDQS